MVFWPKTLLTKVDDVLCHARRQTLLKRSQCANMH